MLQQIIIGSGLAFTAAISPGPFQAYLFSRVTAIGWRRTLPASLAPLISDGPIALLALLLLGRLSPLFQNILQVTGGLFLIFLAWRTLRQWQQPQTDAVSSQDQTPRTLFEAVLVNLLNPNPYLGWTLVLGPIVVAAWQEAPSAGVAVVVAFYTTMVLMLAMLIILFGTAQYVGQRYQRYLLLLSALILAGIGCLQLALGLT